MTEVENGGPIRNRIGKTRASKATHGVDVV